MTTDLRFSQWVFGAGALFTLAISPILACSSASEAEPEEGVPNGGGDGSFCGALAGAYAKCGGGGGACGDTIKAECTGLVGILNPTIVSAATTCVKEASCESNPLACLGRAIASAEATEVQRGLANTFCESCAVAPGDLCKSAFYGTGSVPGLGIALLPFGDRPVASVSESCTSNPLGKIACQAAFSTCLGATATKVLAETISPEAVKCVLTAINEGLSPSGSSSSGGSSGGNPCAGCAGCCKDGVCKGGSEVNACGAGGGACETCADGASCSGGACVTPCGPDNCAGCCNSAGACVSGTANTGCGTHGGACKACATNETCSGGACVAASCSASCASGCCTALGCQPGTAKSACGGGGDACTDCGAGRTCDQHACVVDTTAKWDFYLVHAKIPEKNASNGDWDSFGGLPDPFAQGTTATATGTTNVVSDTSSPWFSGALLSNVTASTLMSQLRVEVWDDDPAFDDHVGLCVIRLDASSFDGNLRTATCPASPGDVAFTLDYRLKPH